MASGFLGVVHRSLDQALEGLERLLRRARRRAEQAAGSVAEEIEQAAVAPRDVVKDVERALHDWGRSALALLAIVLAALTFGTVVLVVLTVGLVEAADRWLGDPWGDFAVVGLYALAALATILLLERAAKRERREAAGELERAKEDALRAVGSGAGER